MDQFLNPFTPNAGKMPPLLAGRRQEVGQLEFLVNRLRHGFSDQSLLLTGLRGVGKTVLLNEMINLSVDRDCVVIRLELSPDYSFINRFAAECGAVLHKLSPGAFLGEKVKRVGRILSSIGVTYDSGGYGSFKASLGDLGPEVGIGDSGVLDVDLTKLFVALGEAAKDLSMHIVVILDEMQYASTSELRSLVMALHRVNQDGLPICMVAAGLPQLVGMIGQAQTYSSRQFKILDVGGLGVEGTSDAIRVPFEAAGARVASGALDAVYEHTQGHPFFVQKYGQVLWNNCHRGEVFAGDVTIAFTDWEDELDQDFFRFLLGKLSPTQMKFCLDMAMAKKDWVGFEDFSHSSAAEQVIPQLLESTLIYEPRDGKLAFAVPKLANYLLRRCSDISSDS